MSPMSLAFNATAGGSNPSTQNVLITNTGTGPLTWTVTDNANWLTATQSGNSVVASVNIAGLAAGNYSGVITVSASGATNTPRSVPVTLTVAAAPQPTTGSVTLFWSANTESDLAGYKVYRATSSGGYSVPIATLTAGTTQYISSGLAKGSTYFFVITAYDQAGNESPYSSETSKSVY
ncbi:MAG: fibronectin type III domain-containing protein [Nitrospirota bacterium]